ncbi:hypothetical protein ABD67_02970 [Bacillus sonorensis]|uniref:hypothetical protein n=1 Tax=Bacillus sonorensis TaxID=119858 RepID=UPI0018CED14F|nr:hypothetical protein [Bacillus sonorensis]MBG9913880.1 hypothetical protein [Bacillus sonorensis]
MDKDTYFIMKPVKGVEEVNHLLQQYDLKQISEMIGIPYSTIHETNGFRRLFLTLVGQTVLFIRKVRSQTINAGQKDESDELTFIKENIVAFKGLLHQKQTIEFTKLIRTLEKIVLKPCS